MSRLIYGARITLVLSLLSTVLGFFLGVIIGVLPGLGGHRLGGQAVALAEIDGLHVPNMNGDLPLIDDDPTRPKEAYFAHVDAVVEAAQALGLYIGMLPTWGDKWNQKWGTT